MFSRYADGLFSPLSSFKSAENMSGFNKNKETTENFVSIISRIKQKFSKANFDTGDILMILIIVFLLFEGDNLEMVITLALVFLLGFDSNQSM